MFSLQIGEFTILEHNISVLLEPAKPFGYVLKDKVNNQSTSTNTSKSEGFPFLVW